MKLTLRLKQELIGATELQEMRKLEIVGNWYDSRGQNPKLHRFADIYFDRISTITKQNHTNKSI